MSVIHPYGTVGLMMYYSKHCRLVRPTHRDLCVRAGEWHMVLDRNTTERLRDVSPVKAGLCARAGFKGLLWSGGVELQGKGHGGVSSQAPGKPCLGPSVHVREGSGPVVCLARSRALHTPAEIPDPMVKLILGIRTPRFREVE